MAIATIQQQGRTTWSSLPADTDRAFVGAETTIAQLAARLHVPVDDLLRANPQITDPNRLTSGMEIQVPPQSNGGAPAGDAVEDPSTDATSPAGAMQSEALDRQLRDPNALTALPTIVLIQPRKFDEYSNCNGRLLLSVRASEFADCTCTDAEAAVL